MRRPAGFFPELTPTAIAAGVLLSAAVLLGGASRQHELRLAFVELAALPAALLGLLALWRSGEWTSHRLALGLAAAIVALPLLQLLPLPPGIWTSFPGRQQSVLALELIGQPASWAPLTLTPDKTWRSMLALLPPIGMLLACLASPTLALSRLFKLMLAALILAITLGAAQLASGGDGLYPWRTTDAGNVVGFFANRNHLATLCLMGMPFMAVLGGATIRRRNPKPQVFWFSVLGIALVLVALAAIRSRTGVVMAGPALLASLAAAWVAAGRGKPSRLLLGGAVASVIVTGLIVVFAMGPLLDRFDNAAANVGRAEKWPIVAEAASTYLPLGSGIGSFDAVYRSVEPLDQLDATFFNQAHNDYLESWLETGWFGLALLGVFLFWYGRRAWAAWRGRPSTLGDLQRAASIGIAAVLVHSFVDYPLRTATIATVFAMCCAVLELTNRAGNDDRRGGGTA